MTRRPAGDAGRPASRSSRADPTTDPARRGPATRGGAAEPIGNVLRRVMGEIRPVVRRGSGISAAWARAVGDELAAETRAVALQRGVLVVEARSSSLVAELQGFRREELLAKVLEVDPTGRITGLRFRPGVF